MQFPRPGEKMEERMLWDARETEARASLLGTVSVLVHMFGFQKSPNVGSSSLTVMSAL